MNKNIRRNTMTGVLTLSLLAGSMQPCALNASAARLNKSHLTMAQGTRRTLKVKGMSGTVIWKSSKKKVVVVDKKGRVTARKAGKAKIIAKIKSRKFVCKVTVKKRKPGTTQIPAITQKPGSAQTPSGTQWPVATGTPAATQKPAATQTPAATQKPIATQTPTATGTPAATRRPVFTFFPAGTQKPVTTPAPSATQKPIATQMPTGTQNPIFTQNPVTTQTPSASQVTEESAYQTLNSLRSTYPEGMPLTNSYYYYSPQFGNGYGCYGFAAKLSDTVFGTAQPYKTHSTFSKIKVGDNIRISNSHSVVVLTKNENDITVVEGNYNSSVHWDRKITSASLASSGFTVYTRY